MSRKRKSRVSEKQDQSPVTTSDTATEVVGGQIEPDATVEAVADVAVVEEVAVTVEEVANLALPPEVTFIPLVVASPSPSLVVVSDAKATVSVKETVAPPSLVHIEQAANELVKNFRPGWMAAIKVRAGIMNVDVKTKQPLDVWRAVFVAWGGQSVIK